MGVIEMEEGQTLEEIKAKLKPKKSTISAEMLDTANSYDDKVALIRMIVADEAGRVSNRVQGLDGKMTWIKWDNWGTYDECRCCS